MNRKRFLDGCAAHAGSVTGSFFGVTLGLVLVGFLWKWTGVLEPVARFTRIVMLGIAECT